MLSDLTFSCAAKQPLANLHMQAAPKCHRASLLSEPDVTETGNISSDSKGNNHVCEGVMG